MVAPLAGAWIDIILVLGRSAFPVCFLVWCLMKMQLIYEMKGKSSFLPDKKENAPVWLTRGQKVDVFICDAKPLEKVLTMH